MVGLSALLRMVKEPTKCGLEKLMISSRFTVIECEPADMSQIWLATAAKIPSNTVNLKSGFRSRRFAISCENETS